MFQFSVKQLEDIPRCYRAALETLGTLSSETQYAVMLVIDELCANVVEHSSCSANVELFADERFLHVTVTGKCGFCEKKIHPAGLFDERGRGVFLVRQFCHEFCYEDGGKTAKAVIRIEDESTC